jgi:hypothetical protein
MLQRAVVILIFLMSEADGAFALSGDCRRFAVTAADGYANVRAAARVLGENVVGVLASGMSIEPVGERKGWFRIASPVAGWIAATQVSAFPCASARGPSSRSGLAAIDRLAGKAVAGDKGSAATFLKMSRGVDGALAEAYAEAITGWAVRNPAPLLSLLEKQSQSVREAALKLLDFGLGARQPGERQQVEAAIAGRPGDKTLAQEWSRIKGQ